MQSYVINKLNQFAVEVAQRISRISWDLTPLILSDSDHHPKLDFQTRQMVPHYFIIPRINGSDHFLLIKLYGRACTGLLTRLPIKTSNRSQTTNLLRSHLLGDSSVTFFLPSSSSSSFTDVALSLAREMVGALTTSSSSVLYIMGQYCMSLGSVVVLAGLAAFMVVLPLMLPPLPPPPLMLLFFPVGIMAALMFLAFSPAENVVVAYSV